MATLGPLCANLLTQFFSYVRAIYVRLESSFTHSNVYQIVLKTLPDLGHHTQLTSSLKDQFVRTYGYCYEATISLNF